MEYSLYHTAAVRVLPLGAGSEVGRSCVVAQFRNTFIMFDCGVHPAYTGISSLPFFDLINPLEIDAILVTHFHLDHAGSLPYFTERTSFKGKVYMTHPTRAIFRWLLNDYVRVSNASSKNDLFTEKELAQCYDKIIPIDYGQEIKLKSIIFTAYNAGHVLGAAMFLVRNEDVSLLYTGDYSREEDRHLRAAQIPLARIDVLVSESTYGVQCHQSKEERESRFTSEVSEIVRRGGKCLLPVFALGRAQELLLILDEYWESCRDLQGIPIYYASALAKRCMAVYQTYLNMMNDKIQRMAEISNPFHFKHVQSIKNVEAYEDRGPCVMMASPGMLQNGLSRDLFEMWCGDRRNGCIIPGYCVEGTLAKELLCDPEEILSLKGHRLAVKASINYISFSAHVDFIQNAEFIEECKTPEVVLVHGEGSEMGRLRSALIHRSEVKGGSISVHTPRNGEWVEIQGPGHLTGRYIGSEIPSEIEGVVHIAEDGNVSVVQKTDLFKLDMSEIKMQEIIRVQGMPFSLFTANASQILPHSSIVVEKDRVEIEGVVITDGGGHSLVLQWESSFERDAIANCLIMAITSTDGAIDRETTRKAVQEAAREAPKEASKKSIRESTKKNVQSKAKSAHPESRASGPQGPPKHCLESAAQIFATYFKSSYEKGCLVIEEGDQKIEITQQGVTGSKPLAEKVQEIFDSVSWVLEKEGLDKT